MRCRNRERSYDVSPLHVLMDRRVRPGDDTVLEAILLRHCAALMPRSLPVSAACAFCASIAALNSAALPGLTT